MAVLVENTITLIGGIQVDQLYIRLDHYVNRFGSKIQYVAYPYYSREEYLKDRDTAKNDRGLNLLKVENFQENHTVSYDNEVDESDILSIVHNSVKSYLTTDLTREVPVIDPSTGNSEYETIVIREKLATSGQISFVDVSLG